MENRLGEVPGHASGLELPPALLGYFNRPDHVTLLAQGDERLSLAITNHYAYGGVDAARGALRGLINLSSQDTEHWTQDHRDATIVAAESIISHWSAESIETIKFFPGYIEAVKSLPKNVDYFGAPHSLYEMGMVLAQNMRSAEGANQYRARLLLREAWSDYYGTIEDPQVKDIAKDLIKKLVAEVTPAAAPGQKAQEWTRREPPMKPETKQLHDFYIKEATARGSLKRYLYEQTPEFQSQVAAHGSELSRFWNLTDPEQMVAGVKALVQDPRMQTVVDMLSRELTSKYTLSIADILQNPQLGKVYADQIHHAALEIPVLLYHKMHDADALYSTMYKQAAEALSARRPARKLTPVHKFLTKLGLPSDQQAAELVDYLSNPSTKQVILDEVNAQNAQLLQQVDYIQSLFPELPYSYLSFMERNEDDLYEGDKANDCTAYHLNNGFNAWTMPHWLANPGFMMAYISDEGTRVAKMGLILAQDEQGLRIVIDSIETYSDIKNSITALSSIHEGIAEVQKWSTANGFGDVLFCSITNSSELSMELPLAANQIRPTQLEAFGTETGLQEVWRSIPGHKETDTISIGYLQSVRSADYDDTGRIEMLTPEQIMAQEAGYQSMRELESLLSRTQSEAVFEQARNGNRKALVATYVAELLPNIHRIFGETMSYSRYAKHVYFPDLLEVLRREVEITDEVLNGKHTPNEVMALMDSVRGPSGEVLGPKRMDWIRNNVTVKDPELLMDRGKRFALSAEADRLDELVRVMKRVAKFMPLKKALPAIFGESEPVIQEGLLSRDLKIIDKAFLALLGVK